MKVWPTDQSAGNNHLFLALAVSSSLGTDRILCCTEMSHGCCSVKDI